MNVKEFNQLNDNAAREILAACCGSSHWVDLVMEKRPYKSEADLTETVENAWYNRCDKKEWLEAFSNHPKIGDVKSLTKKFASTAHLAGKEQAGVGEASEDVIQMLSHANEEYEKKFGFIFIVCATGKSATEMLRLLHSRLQNNEAEELTVAMGEQHKITLLRLQKSLVNSNWGHLKVSQVTTHVLDTASGIPGIDISIRLQRNQNGSWQTMAQGVTNADGRISNLLPPGRIIPPAVYRMVFDTGEYFGKNNSKGFYPLVEIQFEILDDSHYHVPLLVSPFGYSTYRGS